MTDDEGKPKMSPEAARESRVRASRFRKQADEANARERSSIARMSRRIEDLHKEREWPVYGPSNPSWKIGRPAEIDAEDVQAPLPDDMLDDGGRSIRQAVQAAAGAAPDFARDEGLEAHRRAERAREAAKRATLVGPVWTEEMVEARLDEAFKILFRTGAGRLGPRAYGNAMPTPTRTWADQLAQAQNGSLRKAMRRLERAHGPPTADEVRRQDEALAWAGRYLADDERDARIFVNLGAMWRAWGASISRKCAEHGFRRQTFYRQRKLAIRRIVEGLNRDGRTPT